MGIILFVFLISLGVTMGAIVFALLHLVTKMKNIRGEKYYEEYNNSDYSILNYEYLY